jgi:hypothetical protein
MVTIKELISQILEALAGAGIQMDQAAKEKAAAELEDLPIAHAGSVLQEGQVAVNEDFWNSQRKDLKDFKQKYREEKTAHEGLQDSLQAGDSTNQNLIKEMKSKLETMDGQNQLLVQSATAFWSMAKDQIPADNESLRKAFHFANPEKGDEGKLTTDQLVHNVKKFQELTNYGVVKFSAGEEGNGDGKGKKDPPTPAKSTPGSGGKDDRSWEQLPAQQKIEAGYKEGMPEGPKLK